MHIYLTSHPLRSHANFLKLKQNPAKDCYVLLKKTERFVNISYKSVLSQTDNKDTQKKYFLSILKYETYFEI